ncbi:hypothetical protein SDJN02_26348, partial [Cucurbita argyrosperma subsp. argyrosperma]
MNCRHESVRTQQDPFESEKKEGVVSNASSLLERERNQLLSWVLVVLSLLDKLQKDCVDLF